jgi:Zn-finger nucleic acid-binding protein
MFKNSYMKCPNCNVSLVMTDRSGIEIDYCPDCRGVWLDRGELDKIIERSTPSTKSFEQDNHFNKQRYSTDKDFYYKKKKGGILGELFDF